MQSQAVMPSPARLGLAGPPLSPAGGAAAAASTSASVSGSSSQNAYATQLKVAERNAPLYTLPPRKRAQALLNELAGLCTRLFEVSGNRAAWYRGTLPTFLPGSCLCPEAASATNTKDILKIAESYQNMLDEAVSELIEMEKIEQQKAAIAEDVRAKDSAVHGFAKKLGEAQQVLDQILEDYDSYRKCKRSKSSISVTQNDDAAFAELNLSQIFSYAHKISYTTFAPPDFGADQGPLRGALPPAPQEEHMRASLLYQYADLDVGIPKQPATEALTAAIIEPPPEPAAVRPSTEAVPGFVPPLPPPGWRPGMPIDLSAMPAMPPGWKPGDPVPLPPAFEIPSGWKPGNPVVLPKPEEVVQAPPRPATAPGAPEPIQVKYVELDINPESQDDFSSEYTSEGSSDDGEED